MRYPITTLALGLCYGLCSCRVGPDYHPPLPQAPTEWKHAAVEQSTPPLQLSFWWEIFQDDTLNCLEQQAIENNPNLAIALARIDEAWALAGVSRASLFPQLTFDPAYNNSEQLFKLYLPGNIDKTQLSNLGAALSQPFRAHILQYTFPINLSYELDLWGKYRSRYESAVSNAQLNEESYHTALLSLTSDVANSYYQLRMLEALVNILRQTTAVRNQSLELAQNRYTHGIATASDVVSAKVELANTEADLADALRQQGLQENILALLIGKPAPEFTIAVQPLTAEPPSIPAGLPLAMLQQRPDIAQAERGMASEHALTRAAYADLYPSLTLTGSLGFLSPTFDDFFTWLSRYWAFGANAGQAIFDGGRRENNVYAAWARFAQATGSYRLQVLTAFKEVEDALNNLEYQKMQADSLQASVIEASTLTGLSENRYRQGTTNYIEVVTNERTQLNAQRNYIIVLGARYQSTIQLIKALGGAWDSDGK